MQSRSMIGGVNRATMTPRARGVGAPGACGATWVHRRALRGRAPPRAMRPRGLAVGAVRNGHDMTSCNAFKMIMTPRGLYSTCGAIGGAGGGALRAPMRLSA